MGNGTSKTRLFIGSLSWDAKEQDLEEIFEQYGTIVDCKVVTERETGKSRGFAFVEMASAAEAEKALAAEGENVCGRKIKVSFAQEKTRR